MCAASLHYLKYLSNHMSDPTLQYTCYCLYKHSLSPTGVIIKIWSSLNQQYGNPDPRSGYRIRVLTTGALSLPTRFYTTRLRTILKLYL